MPLLAGVTLQLDELAALQEDLLPQEPPAPLEEEDLLPEDITLLLQGVTLLMAKVAAAGTTPPGAPPAPARAVLGPLTLGARAGRDMAQPAPPRALQPLPSRGGWRRRPLRSCLLTPGPMRGGGGGSKMWGGRPSITSVARPIQSRLPPRLRA